MAMAMMLLEGPTRNTGRRDNEMRRMLYHAVGLWRSDADCPSIMWMGRYGYGYGYGYGIGYGIGYLHISISVSDEAIM